MFLFYDDIPQKSSYPGDFRSYGHYDSKENEENAHQDEHFPYQSESSHYFIVRGIRGFQPQIPREMLPFILVKPQILHHLLQMWGDHHMSRLSTLNPLVHRQQLLSRILSRYYLLC